MPDEPRPPLNRRSILELAIDLVDREGLHRLTMRRLGAECGVEAMALYRYVHGREDLLSGIVDHLVDRLRTDQLAARRQEDGWQDFLVRLAHGVRQIALDHPELFPLVATRPPEAPWVRPPLRSLQWMETFLDTLLSYGFDDVAAVVAYRSYTTFLLGQLLLEVSARTPSPQADSASGPAPVRDLSAYPQLRRLQPMLAQDQSLEEFEDALEALLDRLEALLTRR
ncbi:TetR/AcrR family transcriptional regulator [Nocardia wallacei]|uniref:Putative transcriptional regulator, TetR family protein n=1 Tax=Nocardia wallacei TaxID=480035 RepID=A0A7G1KSG0_9NOCA|nr:TetR/AcrR family transcriptional regulator C-terminal domain-containing protein [Nocardia wallacei]BCK57841.1 putative transcriptional regulator, TetR family protein [Nocardia wallacei]